MMDVVKGAVNQRSFVKAIIKFVLTANNHSAPSKTLEKRVKAFLNYWKAVAFLLDDGGQLLFTSTTHFAFDSFLH
jgi:hypothetical protein